MDKNLDAAMMNKEDTHLTFRLRDFIGVEEIGVSTKEGFREHCSMVHIGPGFRPKVERMLQEELRI